MNKKIEIEVISELYNRCECNYVKGQKWGIDEYINVAKKINMIEKTAYTFKIINEFYNFDFISKFNIKANTDSILSDEFMNKIYDHKNKTIILRNESFYDTAFSCVL